MPFYNKIEFLGHFYDQKASSRDYLTEDIARLVIKEPTQEDYNARAERRTFFKMIGNYTYYMVIIEEGSTAKVLTGWRKTK